MKTVTPIRQDIEYFHVVRCVDCGAEYFHDGPKDACLCRHSIFQCCECRPYTFENILLEPWKPNVLTVGVWISAGTVFIAVLIWWIVR